MKFLRLCSKCSKLIEYNYNPDEDIKLISIICPYCGKQEQIKICYLDWQKDTPLSSRGKRKFCNSCDDYCNLSKKELFNSIIQYQENELK